MSVGRRAAIAFTLGSALLVTARRAIIRFFYRQFGGLHTLPMPAGGDPDDDR